MTVMRQLVWAAFACVGIFAVVAVTIESVERLWAGSVGAVYLAGSFALAVAAGIVVAGPRVLEFLDDTTARIASWPELPTLTAILAIGVALRLAWVGFAGVTLTSDGSTYFELARRLVANGEYLDPRGDRAYWPPGYPFFLFALMSVFGVTRDVVVVGNLAAFVMALTGAWWLGRTLVSPAAGLLAALLVAVWPNLVILVGTGSKESLMLAAITASVCLYVRAARASSTLSSIGCSLGAGVALGAASLSQPSLMLFPFVFTAAELLDRGSWTASVCRVGTVVIAMALVILPWTVRNAEVLGSAVPVSTNGGDVFYRANNPLASGGYLAQGPVDLRQYGEVERGKVGYRLALEWIRENPLDFMRLAVAKQVIFLGDNANAVFDALKRRQGQNSPGYVALKGICNLFWLALWLVILAGWRRGGGASLSGPVALLPLAFLYLFALDSVFESGSRHHVPVAVLLAVLAAAALVPSVATPAVAARRSVDGEAGARSTLASQFLKFASVGVIGTVAHYAVLAALVELFRADAVFASAVGFIVGAAVNYVLNYRYTFQSRALHRVAAPKFLTIAAVGFVVNVLAMALGVTVLGLHYLLAQVVAHGVALIWNFLGNRAWTFRGEVA